MGNNEAVGNKRDWFGLVCDLALVVLALLLIAASLRVAAGHGEIYLGG